MNSIEVHVRVSLAIFHLKGCCPPFKLLYTGRNSPATNQIASLLLTIKDNQQEQTEYDGKKHRGM